MELSLVYKSLHLLGVVVFLGNVIVTAWWKAQADRTRNPVIVAFAQRQVTLTDWVFTFGGVLLVGAAGYADALSRGLPLDARWLLWGQGLFVLSGLLWVGILVPVQSRQARLARGFAAGGAIPEDYLAAEPPGDRRRHHRVAAAAGQRISWFSNPPDSGKPEHGRTASLAAASAGDTTQADARNGPFGIRPARRSPRLIPSRDVAKLRIERAAGPGGDAAGRRVR